MQIHIFMNVPKETEFKWKLVSTPKYYNELLHNFLVYFIILLEF